MRSAEKRYYFCPFSENHCLTPPNEMASFTTPQPPQKIVLGFNAEVTNSKPLIDTLSGIHNGKEDQHTLCTVDEDGITFKVHDLGNNIQGLATFNSSLFREFVLDQGLNVMEFKINVASVLKCLNIYGQSSITQTCTSMEYDQESPDFRLLLGINSGSASNISTQCCIKTLAESEQSFNDHSDLFTALRDSETIGQAIIFSESLSDAFCEIYSLPGAATVSLLISPAPPYFQLSAEGTTGKCTIEFPKGSESFKNFMCERTIRNHYQLSLLQDALKVLPSSHQTNIQMSNNGLLCFQHRLQHKSGDVSYVEFVILPDDDGNEEEEEEEEEEDGDGDGEGGRRRQEEEQEEGSEDSEDGGHGRGGRGSQRKKRRRNDGSRHEQVDKVSQLFDDDEDDDEEESNDPYDYDNAQEDLGSRRRERQSSGTRQRRKREEEEEGGEEEEEEEEEEDASDHSVIGPSGDEVGSDYDDDADTQVE